jgi:tetratricopeptide (TPR) repeat protein
MRSPAEPFKVFLSSTEEDLGDYIAVARDVINAEPGFVCDHFKRWPATGRPSVPTCIERVGECQALVVIVAHRYGWIPSCEEGGDGHRSITRIEVDTARKRVMLVLPFLVDPGYDWPEIYRESEQRPRQLLQEFRKELSSTAVRIFTSPESLRIALADSVPVLRKEASAQPPRSPTSGGDPFVYGMPTQGFYNHFTDRTAMLRRLVEVLTGGAHRGVVILGRSGYGKSALANRAVETLGKGSVDGIIHLASESHHDITLLNVFTATMEAVGRSRMAYEGSWRAFSRDIPALVEQLLACFGERRLLFVFDGFESKLDDAGRVVDKGLGELLRAFLAGGHRCKIVMTSCSYVSVPADDLPSLLVIRLDRGLDPDEALVLVKELMTSSGRADFSDTQLRTFIDRVDGVPFLLKRLFELWCGDPLLEIEGATVHEEILSTLIDRAHSRLSVHGRRILHALSVFDEPVGEDAVACVLEPFLTQPLKVGLAEALRAGFVDRVRGTPHFSMHRLDKEAGYRDIARSGDYDAATLHRRAAEFYGRAFQERDHWYQWESRDELLPSLRMFQQLRKAGDDAAAAQSMSISKVEFLNWTGHVTEVRGLFEGLNVGTRPSRALLIQKYALTDALAVLGPFEMALSAFDPVVAMAHELGDSGTEAAALYEAGLAARYCGDSKGSVDRMVRALALVREAGDEERLTYYRFGYSLACTYAGRYADAIREGLEQIAFGEARKDAYFLARGDACLCLPLYLLGMARPASERARRCAEVFSESRHRYHVGFAENVRGLALLEIGQPESSREAFLRALENARTEVQPRVTCLAQFNLAWLHYVQGQLADAKIRADEAKEAFVSSSPGDVEAADALRQVVASAERTDPEGEARALWQLVQGAKTNVDLVRRPRVAERASEVARSAGLPRIVEAADRFLADDRAVVGAMMRSLGPTLMARLED